MNNFANFFPQFLRFKKTVASRENVKTQRYLGRKCQLQVLYDLRADKEERKLDRINPSLSFQDIRNVLECQANNVNVTHGKPAEKTRQEEEQNHKYISFPQTLRVFC